MKYSIGTTKLVLAKNRIAPGEFLTGSLSLNLEPSINLSQITVSLSGYERSKSLLFQYILKTISHPILNMNITSTSSGPSHHNFNFKLPEKLQPSLYASGKDYEISHTYHIETRIQAWGISYISRHEILVKSISYEYEEVEYSPPPETQLVSTSEKADFNSMPVEATQRDGIVSCSQIGVEGKFIDIEAVMNFTNLSARKYTIKYGITRNYSFINRLNMHDYYTDTGYHESQQFNAENNTIRFLMSIPVNKSSVPCYKGIFCSLENKVFFSVCEVDSDRQLFIDTKTIPIKSAYDTSTSTTTEAKLINSFVQSYHDKHHVFAEAIFLRYAVISVGIIIMYLSRPKGEKIKYLLEEDETESKKDQISNTI